MSLLDFLTAEWRDPEPIAWSIEIADSAQFTAETVIGTVSFHANAGCTYRLKWRPLLRSTVPDDIMQVTIREDTAAGTERAAARVKGPRYRRWDPPPGPCAVEIAYQYTAAESGPKTFVATAHRVHGTGDLWRLAADYGDIEQRFRVLHMDWHEPLAAEHDSTHKEGA